MDFESERDRALFFNYSVPCAKVFVKRKILKQEDFDKLIESVSKNKQMPEGTEKIFELALRKCKGVVNNIDNQKINEKAIREYFWIAHDRVAKIRYGEMHDFDLDECIVYPGKVLDIKNKKALVNTPVKTNYYRTDFVSELKKGDYVVVHYDFIVEKIPEEKAKLLWKLKESYFKSKKV